MPVSDLGTPGDPDCAHCRGEGIVSVAAERPRYPPVVQMCRCVLHREILANVERGCRGLTTERTVPSSPLRNHIRGNLWVTGTRDWFMAHLRHVAIRQPPNWAFKVVTDVDLITAWLATAAASGAQILDGDAREESVSVSLAAMTLPDLVIPPTLLVIRLGVKKARNVAMPEVLLEAITLRDHARLPTWVWDQPELPLAFGHISHSPDVDQYLSRWERVVGGRDAGGARAPKPAQVAASRLTAGSLLAPSVAPTTTRTLEPEVEDEQDVVVEDARGASNAASAFAEADARAANRPRPKNKSFKGKGGGFGR